MHCKNYRENLLLSTSYTILSTSLWARMFSYLNEIVGENQCGLGKQPLQKYLAISKYLMGLLWIYFFSQL